MQLGGWSAGLGIVRIGASQALRPPSTPASRGLGRAGAPGSTALVRRPLVLRSAEGGVQLPLRVPLTCDRALGLPVRSLLCQPTKQWPADGAGG